MPKKKIKFKYNPDTLSYDRIERGPKYYFNKVGLHLLFGMVLGVMFFFAYSYIFDSPKEKRLVRENARLETQFELMSKKFDLASDVLDDIQMRDENIYRVIYQADSIPNSIRKAGFGGVNKYKDLEDLSDADLVINTSKKLDIIMKQMYVQSKSFDEIVDLAKNKEKLLRATPAIMPISNKDLRRTASGWGYRIHPIYKTKKFHYGMDFSSPEGSDVYATADGTVSRVLRSRTGYGNHIEIDHGFGYKTLYGHMSGFNVKKGQKVKRGDVIGYVGSTGTSTAPHLHYEVMIKNKKVNPTHYYFNDLTPQEYDEMIRISSNSNQTFD